MADFVTDEALYNPTGIEKEWKGFESSKETSTKEKPEKQTRSRY